MSRGKPPMEDNWPDICAECLCSAWAGQIGQLWQVKCVIGGHRSRFYLDRRGAVMAWNATQLRKRTYGPRRKA